jgi:hypothetical protein
MAYNIKELVKSTSLRKYPIALLIWAPVFICAGLIAIASLIMLVQAVRAFFKAESKWAFIVVTLYSAFIIIVLTPLIYYIGICLGTNDVELSSIFDYYIEVLSAWQAWLYFAILIITELSLLTVRVGKTGVRTKPRSGIQSTAMAAAGFFSILLLGIIWSIIAAIFGDGSIHELVLWAALIFLVVNWIVWAFVFRSFARDLDSKSFLRRLMKWLLRGSILELLIAVPSHIIVRQKDVCCAYGITALGIAMGLAIMLLSFGPGIYFLYADRIKQKQIPKKPEQTENPIEQN